MRYLKLFIAFLIYGVCPLVSVAQQTPKSIYINENFSIGYLEYLPPNYETATKKLPVLIFLHGSGEVGNGLPEDLKKVETWGPPYHIKNGHNMCFTVNGEEECFIVFSPQLVADFYDWANVVTPLIDHILNGPDDYKADPDRIYLTGLSLGGMGTYAFASSQQNRPNKIAAIVPIAALTEDYEAGCLISARKIPVWAFHGKLDTVVPWVQGVTAFNSVKFCGDPLPTAEMIFTTYNDRYHDSWIPAYDPSHTYHNPNLYEWLLLQTRSPVEEEVTSVNEEIISGEGSFTVYPNPSRSDVNFLFSETQIPGGNISVWDVTGKLVLRGENGAQSMDITGLNPGIYLVRFTTDSGTTCARHLVKM